MKKTLSITLAFFATFHIFAQSSGNYQQSEQYEPVQQQEFYNSKSRAVAPASNGIYMDNNEYKPKAYPAQTGNNFAGENQVVFDVKALLNQKASQYVAVFSLTQVGTTTEETDRLLNERYAAFEAGALQAGVSKEDIYLDMVSFVPRYEYQVSKKVFSKKSYTEVPKGFVLQKNIHIRFTKPELLDKLVSIAAKNEIYDLVKVDYITENPDKIYQTLRAKVFEYLNQQVKSYKDIGFQLDTTYKVVAEKTWVTYPATRYQTYIPASTISIDAITKQGTQITEATKTRTSFYEPVSPVDYDIVINPVIVEPVVQYSLILKIKFTYRERLPYSKTEYKKELNLITPNGELKNIRLE